MSEGRPTAADLQAIIDRLPASLVALDGDHRVVAVTDRYLEESDKTREDLLGRDIAEAFEDITRASAVDEERRALEERLMWSEALYRSLSENLPDATLVLIDREYCVLMAEGEMVRQLAWLDERTWVGTKVTDHLFVPEHVLETALAHYRAAFGGERGTFEVVEAGASIQVTAVPVPGREGRIERVLIVARDVTQVRAAERQQNALTEIGQLALSESDPLTMIPRVTRIVAATLRCDVASVLEVSSEGDLVLAGLEGLELPVDARFPLEPGSQFGVGLAADGAVLLEDLRADDRYPPDERLVDAGLVSGVMVPVHMHDERFALLGAYSRELRRFSADECTFLEGVANVLATAYARHRELEANRHAALHDGLTGLPNRALAIERLRSALARRGRDGVGVGVLVLDADRFKVINDSLGHAAGDELLVALATRLREAMRATDTVARLGGDEFAVVCEVGTDSREVLVVADRVLSSLARPFTVSTGEHFITASMGIAIATTAHDTAASLLRDADTAMYRAKGRGRGRYEVFDDAMRVHALERLRVEGELRRAIHHGELVVHYQPIVDLETGCPLGAEALVRWEHPDRGLLQPGSFIPVAEETGLIAEIGAFVLDTACREAARWQCTYGNKLTISVNVSARQLGDRLFPERAAESARVHGLTPGTVQLEVTESTLMVEADTPMKVLDSLREHGLRLVLDDFGTGFSSLAYLRHFPLDGLKIDRSFLQDIEADPRSAAIVRSVVDMSAELGMSVVAEGIESPEQTARLRSLGCALGQGFIYAQPLTPHAMAAFLAERLSVTPQRPGQGNNKPPGDSRPL